MQQSIVRRTIGPPGIVRHGWVIYHTFLTKGTVLEAFWSVTTLTNECVNDGHFYLGSALSDDV